MKIISLISKDAFKYQVLSEGDIFIVENRFNRITLGHTPQAPGNISSMKGPLFSMYSP